MTDEPTPTGRAAMNAESAPRTDVDARLRASNRRIAFVLLAIAVVFFVGIIATKFMGGPAIGFGVMGTAVLLFLLVAIGRNLVSKR